MKHSHILCAITLSIGVTLSSPSANASAGLDTFTFTYQVREMSTDEGRKALLDRLSYQAKRFCRVDTLKRFERACRRRVIKEVTAAVVQRQLAPRPNSSSKETDDRRMNDLSHSQYQYPTWRSF